MNNLSSNTTAIGSKNHSFSIEEAKNSEAEEESAVDSHSPTARNTGKGRMNNTLSGDGNRSDKNGLNGLIKKIRGNSLAPT